MSLTTWTTGASRDEPFDGLRSEEWFVKEKQLDFR